MLARTGVTSVVVARGVREGLAKSAESAGVSGERHRDMGGRPLERSIKWVSKAKTCPDGRDPGEGSEIGVARPRAYPCRDRIVAATGMADLATGMGLSRLTTYQSGSYYRTCRS